MIKERNFFTFCDCTYYNYKILTDFQNGRNLFKNQKDLYEYKQIFFFLKYKHKSQLFFISINTKSTTSKTIYFYFQPSKSSSNSLPNIHTSFVILIPSNISPISNATPSHKQIQIFKIPSKSLSINPHISIILKKTFHINNFLHIPKIPLKFHKISK